MRRLKAQLLASARAKPAHVVRGDDGVAGDSVLDARVGHLEHDAVAGSEAVDVAEGRAVGRAVRGDVDELSSPGMNVRRSRPGPLRRSDPSAPLTTIRSRSSLGIVSRPIGLPCGRLVRYARAARASRPSIT